MLARDDVFVSRRRDENVNVSNNFVEPHHAKSFHACLRGREEICQQMVDLTDKIYPPLVSPP